MTTCDHHEVDGLNKRMLQMVNKGLWKYGLQKGHINDWDIQL
jgi:hypothetical protein